MNKYNKPTENYRSPVVNDLLNSISKEEFEITEKKMQLAVRIADALDAKGMQKQNFAKALNKQPSEISKWLSGVHNFTIETLYQIEKVLGICLVNWEKEKEIASVYRVHVVFQVQQAQHIAPFLTPINEFHSLTNLWRKQAALTQSYRPTLIRK